MLFQPVLAILDAPIIIGIVVLAALLFGADKLPKLARSAGQAKKEFMMGQIEADQAAAKARGENAPGASATQEASTTHEEPGESTPPPA